MLILEALGLEMFMEGKTAWEAASETAAKTASERYLARLARKAFLSLWSYPNVYTDEGRAKGKGDGKELCDLLVVFGHHVLIFSDKACAFPDHPDIKVAWGRWYKSAVDKSVKQLVGAEKFLRAHPDRLFLDKTCSAPFPIPLPDPASARIHRIAVTRGSNAAAHEYWDKQSSGSLMIDTSVEGLAAHLDVPFTIGWPSSKERFIHVLDEMTLDVLLEELDTLPDLIAYLEAKERFLTAAPFVSVAGEEQLVGPDLTDASITRSPSIQSVQSASIERRRSQVKVDIYGGAPLLRCRRVGLANCEDTFVNDLTVVTSFKGFR